MAVDFKSVHPGVLNCFLEVFLRYDTAKIWNNLKTIPQGATVAGEVTQK